MVLASSVGSSKGHIVEYLKAKAKRGNMEQEKTKRDIKNRHDNSRNN